MKKPNSRSQVGGAVAKLNCGDGMGSIWSVESHGNSYSNTRDFLFRNSILHQPFSTHQKSANRKPFLIFFMFCPARSSSAVQYHSSRGAAKKPVVCHRVTSR